MKKLTRVEKYKTSHQTTNYHGNQDDFGDLAHVRSCGIQANYKKNHKDFQDNQNGYNKHAHILAPFVTSSPTN